LAKDLVGGDVGCSQGLVVFEDAIVELIGDQQVSESVEAHADGIAGWDGARIVTFLGRKARPGAALAEDEIRRRVSRTAGCARCSAHAGQRVQIREDARIARVGDEQVAGGIGGHAARIA
jgi:hypothetical protein